MTDMLGRIVELVVTIPADFRGVLVDLLEKLGGPNRMEWFENLKRFLRKEPCWVEVVETVKSAFDQFFQTRPGLYVDGSFQRLVLAKAREGVAKETRHLDLPHNMKDDEIEEKLGDNHIWEEGTLCATLQKYISEQEGGKEGKLLNNGYANLFYTSSCVVGVRWYADGREWDVISWRRDDGGRFAGYRAFSPAT